jgi:hypothetical protein
MGTIAQGLLFSWEIVDRSPEIQRLRGILDVLPDGKLIRTLIEERKGRRDDYPLEPTRSASACAACVEFGDCRGGVRA